MFNGRSLVRFFFAKSKKALKTDEIIYNPFQALKLANTFSIAPFPETVDFNVILNVNPKHGD